MATHTTNNSATPVSTSNALDLALQKVHSVDVPQSNHIAIAYSGGIDSTLCVKLSEEKYHAKSITAISVDVGQGEEEIQQGIERAHLRGLPYELIARRNKAADLTREGM